MPNLLREPLVHFIVAAGLMFLANGIVGSGAPEREVIRVTTLDLERMAAVYAGEADATPAPEDLQAMVLDHVETAALANEARRLGLDEGDVVVQRRLAQKMRFMVDDLATPDAPADATLRAWFEANPERFSIPARYSFEHIYLREPDGGRVTQMRSDLAAGADWQRLGDAFMLQRAYAELPRREIARLFGAEFAQAIADAPIKEWSGPASSAFGIHLIRVTESGTAQAPDFEMIRARIEEDWRISERRRLNAEAVADIIAKYDVDIEGAE